RAVPNRASESSSRKLSRPMKRPSRSMVASVKDSARVMKKGKIVITSTTASAPPLNSSGTNQGERAQRRDLRRRSAARRGMPGAVVDRGVERLLGRGLTQNGLGDLLAQELCRALPGERRRPPGHGFLDLGGGLHADGAVVGAVVLGEVFVLEGAGGGGEHRGLLGE